MTINRIHIFGAAALLVAALCFPGCMTSRQGKELKEQLDRVETKVDKMQKQVATVDSTVATEALESKKLRTDMNLTIDELRQQINALLENYNDLMKKLDNLGRLPRSTKPDSLKSSPGATDGGQMSAQSEAECDNKYDESFILVRGGQYDNAIQGFKDFLTTCPGHKLTENALYWIGECYYALEKYTDAITQFEAMLNQFKSSSLTMKALYKLGRSQQELGKKAEAKKTFQRIIDEFPNTLEAEQSRERLKDLR